MAVFVVCEVSAGLRDSEASIAVRRAEGGKVFLRIERDVLKDQGGNSYLSVGVVHYDRPNSRALIELPHEADSGANRVWVRDSDLLHETPQASGVPA